MKIEEKIGEKRTVLGSNGERQTYITYESAMSEIMQQILAAAPYDGQSIDRYKLLDDAYRASGGFESGDYIIPHVSEMMPKYLRRKNMAYFINYVKPITTALVNPIFKTDPIRDNMSSTYPSFAEDVDGNNTTLTRFMKRAAIRAKLHGVEFIVIDMEKLEQGVVITQKDRIEKRLFPYLYLVSPAQVERWYTDKLGRLVSITYWIEDVKLESDGSAKQVIEHWTWTNDFYIKEVEGVREKNVNPVGVIPIIPLYGTRNDSDTLIPQSDLYAIARTNHALYNACSELRERNRAQAFSLLTIPIDEDDDFDGEDTPIKYGTADTLIYKQGSQSPEWITPPSASSDIIENEINLMVREIYRMANLRLKSNSIGYNISGIAMQYDNQQLYQSIAEFAQEIKDTEEKIAFIFGRYMGEDNSNIVITYNSDYGIIDTTTVLANATTALQMNISPKVNEEIKRQVIKAMLTNEDNLVLEGALEDFDKNESKGTPITPEQVVAVQPMN